MKYEVLIDLSLNEIDELCQRLVSNNENYKKELEMLKSEVNDLRKQLGLNEKYRFKIHGRCKKYKESHYMKDFEFSNTLMHKYELYVPFNEVVFQLMMMEVKENE